MGTGASAGTGYHEGGDAAFEEPPQRPSMSRLESSMRHLLVTTGGVVGGGERGEPRSRRKRGRRKVRAEGGDGDQGSGEESKGDDESGTDTSETNAIEGDFGDDLSMYDEHVQAQLEEISRLNSRNEHLHRSLTDDGYDDDEDDNEGSGSSNELTAKAEALRLGKGAKVDRLALASLYQSTVGEYWKVKDGWQGEDCSVYWGVIQRRSRVSSLKLIGNHLSGQIPENIGTLKGLNRLFLQSNPIIGQLPDSVGNLRQLVELDISWTSLSGPIPHSITHLSSLQELRLHDNRLTGHLPPNMHRMKSLVHIDVSSNVLTGDVPVGLARLKDTLKYLNLADNDFTGVFPAQIRLIEDCRLFLKGNKRLNLVEGPDGGLNQNLYPFNLVPSLVLMSLPRLLPFEEIAGRIYTTRGVLRKQEDNLDYFRTEMRTGSQDNGGAAHIASIDRDKVAMISHTWLDEEHPDDECNTKLQHIQSLLSDLPAVEYVWIDFCCLPQRNKNDEHEQAVRSLPFYVHHCRYFFALANSADDLRGRYRSRAWCRLEMLLAICPYTPHNMEGWSRSHEETLQFATFWNAGEREETDLVSVAGDELLNPLEGAVSRTEDMPHIAFIFRAALRSLSEHSLINADFFAFHSEWASLVEAGINVGVRRFRPKRKGLRKRNSTVTEDQPAKQQQDEQQSSSSNKRGVMGSSGSGQDKWGGAMVAAAAAAASSSSAHSDLTGTASTLGSLSELELDRCKKAVGEKQASPAEGRSAPEGGAKATRGTSLLSSPASSAVAVVAAAEEAEEEAEEEAAVAAVAGSRKARQLSRDGDLSKGTVLASERRHDDEQHSILAGGTAAAAAAHGSTCSNPPDQQDSIADLGAAVRMAPTLTPLPSKLATRKTARGSLDPRCSVETRGNSGGGGGGHSGGAQAG